jgi:small subunit ribosomal protein S5
MITVTLDGSTIPHDIKIKFKAAKILLLPASEGTGIIAGGTIRKVLELAGVKDILSKSLGTTNKVNNTKATFLALSKLQETPFMVRKAEAKKAAREASKPVPKENKAEAPKQAVKKAPENKENTDEKKEVTKK